MSQLTSTDPEILRAEIDQTRADLGTTIEALTAKLDVKARGKDAVARAASRAIQTAGYGLDRANRVAGVVVEQTRDRAVALRGRATDGSLPATLAKPASMAVLGVAAALAGAIGWLIRRRQS
jgi:hypothetical protein